MGKQPKHSIYLLYLLIAVLNTVSMSFVFQTAVSAVARVQPSGISATRTAFKAWNLSRFRRKDQLQICFTRWIGDKHSEPLTKLYTANRPDFTSHGTEDQSTSSSDASVYAELKWLSKEIRRLDDLYYNTNKQDLSPEQEVDDEDFDALVRREEEISKQYPDLLKKWQEESGWGVQATRQGRVGSPIKEEEDVIGVSNTGPGTDRLKRKHLSDMLSLDNVHHDEQLWAWLKRIPKVFDDDEYLEESKPTRITLITEPKLDGVSLSLRYQRKNQSSSRTKDVYELQCATTRGDGKQGQDVTAAVQAIQTIPAELIFDTTQRFAMDHDLPDQIEVRGEVVLPNRQFNSLAEFAPNSTFANPRNAASGILLRKETTDPMQQEESNQLRSQLHFVAYDLVGEIPLAIDGTHIRGLLSGAGFSLPLPSCTTDLDWYLDDDKNDYSDDCISPMLMYYRTLQDFRENGTVHEDFEWGDYDMDGCVHKISQHNVRQLLGRSTKSPKWAIAHKFPPKAAVTRLLDITVQVGRTGALTPVAILEPVEVAGVTIQRATLHNFGHMQHVLGQMGDDIDVDENVATAIPVGIPIIVRRAGDVIPQVVKRAGGRDSFTAELNEVINGDKDTISLQPPTHCPACQSPVVVEEPSSNTASVGQVIRCGGPPLLCPPRAITSLRHCFSRDAFDVRGLSEARIQQLMDVNLLQSPSDLFNFGEEEWEALKELPGWGQKSSDNLKRISQEVAQEGVSLSRFIYSLGIRHLGQHTSELVATRYLTVEAFMEALEEASNYDETLEHGETTNVPFAPLQGQLGIGPALIESLVDLARNDEMRQTAQKLSKSVRVLPMHQGAEDTLLENEDANETDGRRPWKGKRVVFTGSIPNFSRTTAHAAAKALGAKATPGSVSKSTDIVVYGEKGGKKLEQARTLGLTTMTGEEFVQLVERIQNQES